MPYFLCRSAKPIAALLVAAKAQIVCEKVFFTLIAIPYFLCRSAKPIAALLVAAKAQIICEKVFFTLSSSCFGAGFSGAVLYRAA